MVAPLPLHHAYAFRQMLAYLRAGATLAIAGDIYQALQLLKTLRPTAMLLVPAACEILLAHFSEVLAENPPEAVRRHVRGQRHASPPCESKSP